MTSSFNTYVGTQRDAPPDISQYNYKETDPDLTKSVNQSIDETNAQMAKFWDFAAKQANEYHKNKDRKIQALSNLTTTGLKFANEQKLRNDAAAVVKKYYDIGDNNEIVSRKAFEDVIKNENKLDEAIQEEKTIQKKAQTESRNADKEGLPFIGGLLRNIGSLSSNKIAELLVAREGFDVAFERVANTYEHQLPDGSWITMDQVDPADMETYRYVHRGITEVVIAEILRDNPNANKRLIQKYIVNHAYKKYETDRVKFSEAGVKAEKEVAKNNRKESLNNIINTFTSVLPGEMSSTDPLVIKERNEKIGDSIADYLDTYHGFHDLNRKKGKEEFFEFLIDLWDKGKVSDSQIQAIGDATIKPLDGGKRKVIRDYWSKEFGEFETKLKTKHIAKINKDVQLIEAQKNNAILNLREKYNEDDVSNMSLEQQKKWIEEQTKTFQTSWPEGHPWLKKVLTNAEDSGPDSINEHLQRINYNFYVHGIPPDKDELKHFEPGSPEFRTVYKMTKGVGLSPSERTVEIGLVDSYINNKTQELTGTKDEKSTLWRVMSKNANIDYMRLYWKHLGEVTEDLNLVPTDAQRQNAMSLASKEVRDNIENGAYQQLAIYPPDTKRIKEIADARNALKNDRHIINSKEYWQGEEPHLLAALKYMDPDEAVDIPLFYKDIAEGIKGRNAYEIMESRLVSTGLWDKKNKKPIPERVLDLEKQNKLLNKPSPAKSLRAFYDLEGTELEGLIEVSKFENLDQLMNAFREGAATSNSYTTTGLDWIQQVNIDPQLKGQYNDIFGDIPYYSSFDTLLPGVAEKLVEDTLMEPEQPKIPGSSIYNEKTGTGWKRSELGDWEFYRNFELAEDDSPFSRDWIWDTYRKAWTPSTYIDPLKEPASKVGEYLEQVPGLLRNAFADIPKKLIQEPLETIGDRTTGSGVFEDGRELTIAELKERQQTSKE